MLSNKIVGNQRHTDKYIPRHACTETHTDKHNIVNQHIVILHNYRQDYNLCIAGFTVLTLFLCLDYFLQ